MVLCGLLVKGPISGQPYVLSQGTSFIWTTPCTSFIEEPAVFFAVVSGIWGASQPAQDGNILKMGLLNLVAGRSTVSLCLIRFLLICSAFAKRVA